MKPYYYLMALMGLFVTTSCDNRTGKMFTTVNADGTCSREIFIQAKSDLLQQPADTSLWYRDLLTDSRWEKDFQRPFYTGTQADSTLMEQEKDKTWLHAHRHFTSVEEMGEAFPLRICNQPIVSQCALESEFRWFYTRYTYTERYGNLQSLFAVPLDGYLTQEEALCWFTDDRTMMAGLSGFDVKNNLERIEEKVFRWMSANYFKVCLQTLAENYDSVNQPTLTREEFTASIDSMTQRALAEGFSIMRMSAHQDVPGNFLVKLYGTDVYSKALAGPLSEKSEEAINRLMEPLLLTFQCRLQLIDETFDYTLKSSWLFPQDYVYSWSVKKENPWAYLITLLLCILSIVIIIRQRR